MQLHEKILFYRKKNGLSQEALAEKIGVSRQAVSKWETGDALPEISKLKSLADCFGVTVDFLVDDSLDEMPQSDTPVYEPVNRSNIFDDAIDTVEDRAVPFIEKYAWVGGVLLLLIGGVSLVKGVISLFTIFGVAGNFSAVGVPIFGYIISALFSLLMPLAMVVGGIIIIKKFKP